MYKKNIPTNGFCCCFFFFEIMQTINPERILDIYNNLFLIKGHIKIVTTESPPVRYIIAQIAQLVSCDIQHDFQCVRNVSDTELVNVLLKAVAGNFVTGSSALSPKICNIGIDPVTGYFTLIDEAITKYTTLTCIIVVLFVCLGYFMYKQETDNNNKKGLGF